MTGSAWGDWANYTASPLRAFENELGVQDPVGFWDPAGFTADGSVEDFKRRRQTEIKHGRIAMLAAMGYITPEQLFCKKASFMLNPKTIYDSEEDIHTYIRTYIHTYAAARQRQINDDVVAVQTVQTKDHWQVPRIFVTISRT